MDTHRRPHWLLRALLLVLLIAVMLSPPMLVLVGVWASEESWDFEGRGVKYWFLVKGSKLDQLGLVEPTGTAASYSVKFAEGTDPGSRFVKYASSASPEAVLDAYATRCREMSLKITRSEPSAKDAVTGATAAALTCEIQPYLDATLWAERKGDASETEVSLSVWGSE